ncbi:MAG: site-specific integrase [Selenomonadaceae bacterium]|nr:site-specific integrase [Selenomonadaceae bacterium]MBO6305172.1 site-specific integrase [Selenomonadaceae bacterium]
MPSYKKTLSGGKVSWYVKFYYVDWTGTRQQKKKSGFATKRDADQWERAFLERQAASPDMTFAALVDIYLEDCKSRLKPTTLSQKQYCINHRILPYFKDLPISSITPAQVRKWQNELLEAEYKPGHSKKDEETTPRQYAATYLKTVNAQLSAIFNYAMKFYKLPSNPARLAGSIGKQNSDKVDFWTRKEFDKFMEVVSDKPMSKAAFNILFWTGCRSGELLALTLEDIDFKSKTLRINKSYARLNGEDLIQRPKTEKSTRIITLPDFLLDILREYIAVLYEPQPKERLFNVTKRYLQHEMERGCDFSGVRKIRVHDLRHSHASLLIEMGCSPLLIKERLGHEKIQTTLQTYSHLYPNKQEELAKKLEKFASRKK